MLMISRRVGERIVIGGDIEVTITEIHRRHVRLAINTGKTHQVLRGEVFDSIQSANRLAAESVIDEEALAANAERVGSAGMTVVPTEGPADQEAVTPHVAPAPVPALPPEEEATR